MCHRPRARLVRAGQAALMVVWVLALARAVSAGTASVPVNEPPPWVSDADFDEAGGVLIVVGAHFGTAMPLVLMDGAPLVLVSWAPTEIHAQIPRTDPTAAAHVVEVYRGPLMAEHGGLTIPLAPFPDRLRAPD